MTEEDRKKAAAAAKMAFGAARVASGIATSFGHGMIGGVLKQRHMMRAAVHLGRHSIEAGAATFREGLADWKRAHS